MLLSARQFDKMQEKIEDLTRTNAQIVAANDYLAEQLRQAIIPEGKDIRKAEQLLTQVIQLKKDTWETGNWSNLIVEIRAFLKPAKKG